MGGHQRPILSTVSTCCNIAVVTADKPLCKQPAQIPASRMRPYKSISLAGLLFIEVLPGQQGSMKGGLESKQRARERRN